VLSDNGAFTASFVSTLRCSSSSASRPRPNIEHRARSSHNTSGVAARRRLDHHHRRASKSANYADLEPHAVNAPSTVRAHRRPVLSGHCFA
jgi:hypothetical protein